MKIAVIPARGGSKRIPRKNIRSFGGLPMIAWPIRAAIESNCFDCVIVSTDDQEIAQVAEAHGAMVPFMRPAELSDDHAVTSVVVAHAIRSMTRKDDVIDYVCCIYATAPFVQASDLRRGLQLILSTSADYAISVTSYAFPIQRAIRITPGYRVEMFQPQYLNSRSQDLEKAWHDAGQFYWGKSEAWLMNKPVFGLSTAPVILPRYLVQDVDTPEDWEYAELIFKILNSAENYDYEV